MSGRRLTQLDVRGLAWSGSALTAQMVLNIASVSILARILTPHDFGVIVGAFILFGFGGSSRTFVNTIRDINLMGGLAYALRILRLPASLAHWPHSAMLMAWSPRWRALS